MQLAWGGRGYGTTIFALPGHEAVLAGYSLGSVIFSAIDQIAGPFRGETTDRRARGVAGRHAAYGLNSGGGRTGRRPPGTHWIPVMLGLFARRPRPDAEALARRKRWIADIMSHGDKDHIAIAELVCQVPGCPDLETAVTVTPADRRRFVLRIPPAVGTVT